MKSVGPFYAKYNIERAHMRGIGDSRPQLPGARAVYIA